MPTHEEIRKALESCAYGTAIDCRFCPYFNETSKGVMCVTQMAKDALEYVQELENQREHGKWEFDSTGIFLECSRCHRWSVPDAYVNDYKYCPNCGTKMERSDE